MSRLIDADKTLEDMKRHCVGNCLKCDEFTILSSEPHCGVIDRQPTAYDVEAVVRELEEKMEDCMKSAHICDDMDDYEGAVEWSRRAGAFNKAIEIVKRGGRND